MPNLLSDLRDPRLMYLKAGLFLVIGLLACAGILLQAPSLRIALLLVIAIWAFCRLYYFLFYVIERYIDPEARFAGVGDAAKYLIRRRSQRRARLRD